MTAITIRPLEQSDRAEWRRLWTDYLTFYETSVAEDVYATTWARLFDPGEYEPKGFIALLDGAPAGLVHYLYHRSCWSLVDNCYLQDLFVDPGLRAQGIGRALIRHVYDRAATMGFSRVWWLTHETNTDAMKLYDQVADRSGFVQYRKLLG